jgi:hypothetical protein
LWSTTQMTSTRLICGSVTASILTTLKGSLGASNFSVLACFLQHLNSRKLHSHLQLSNCFTNSHCRERQQPLTSMKLLWPWLMPQGLHHMQYVSLYLINSLLNCLVVSKK